MSVRAIPLGSIRSHPHTDFELNSARPRMPMMIVFNPAAGRRRAQLLWRVLDVMAENGVRLEIAETMRAGHATELARDAASRGSSLVVAAGLKTIIMGIRGRAEFSSKSVWG